MTGEEEKEEVQAIWLSKCRCYHGSHDWTTSTRHSNYDISSSSNPDLGTTEQKSSPKSGGGF